MRVLLDANACLRYLLCDIESQSIEVEQCIRAGAEITIEVLAECVYVLDCVYNLERGRVSEFLISFLEEVACPRLSIARAALEYYSKLNLDFVDCVLLAEVALNNREIFTFDKKLNKNISRMKTKKGL